ncbi:AAA family ATPase [Enteractinococcus coprophilus]|uniref:MinD-like ATPase involved in chromosome partitioning or flagellar assembly n=1 Tax=Enteractinococcus coprophilus TaxID=1027633 RepID=A0A542ZZY4_9MICC|nr:hypothetical protein [Enteractinococcus coprophilus]TQL65898.1 MinD-like ATPase involved in chromosome partitioning or flagellar assembly [Enteractinococcus coprophilus]
MAVLNVATTINPRFDHVTPIESTRSDVTITHRCHIFAELMAVARSGLVDIVLVADDFDLVSLETLQQLKGADGRGPRLAAISDVVDDRQRLTELGIPVASAQLSGPELVDWLQTVHIHEVIPQPQADSSLSPADLQVLAELDPDTASTRRRGRRAAPYDPAKDLPQSLMEPAVNADHSAVHDAFEMEEVSTGDTFGDKPRPTGHVTGPNQEVIAPSAPGTGDPEQPGEAEGTNRGHITAVWGPIGSPGVTTIAVNLAMEAALTGHRTLLIDADTYGAAVSVHLGLLEDSAAIAQACRAAEHRGLDAEGLAAFTQRVTVHGASVEVITGLTRSERWPQVRAAAWAHVLDVARQGWDVIIIDCGFGLEQDEELSFDIPAPQRNATTVTAVTNAENIIAVGTGDPVGFVRFMKDLEHLMETTDGDIIPIVNKVTSMTSGLSPKRQLRGAWERFGPKVPLQQFIGWAPEVTAGALLAGKTLAESAPKAEIRLAIQRLMQACIPSLANTTNAASAKRKSPTKLLKFINNS